MIALLILPVWLHWQAARDVPHEVEFFHLTRAHYSTPGQPDPGWAVDLYLENGVCRPTFQSIDRDGNTSEPRWSCDFGLPDKDYFYRAQACRRPMICAEGVIEPRLSCEGEGSGCPCSMYPGPASCVYP